jgi:hypothetical protein
MIGAPDGLSALCIKRRLVHHSLLQAAHCLPSSRILCFMTVTGALVLRYTRPFGAARLALDALALTAHAVAHSARFRND